MPVGECTTGSGSFKWQIWRLQRGERGNRGGPPPPSGSSSSLAVMTANVWRNPTAHYFDLWAAWALLNSFLPASNTFLQIDHVSVIPSAKAPYRLWGWADHNSWKMQIANMSWANQNTGVSMVNSSFFLFLINIAKYNLLWLNRVVLPFLRQILLLPPLPP